MNEDHLGMPARLPRCRFVLAACVGALFVCPAASSAAAPPLGLTALKAAPQRMVVAPRQDAQLLHSPVRVVVRAPRGTTRLVVRVGRHDVTGRFRRAGGLRRVAYLARRAGVHYGRNHLFVMAQRGARRPRVQARTFYLARRSGRVAHLRVKPGRVTSVRLRVGGPVRRWRSVRLRLNGRSVTRAARRPGPRLWTESLSATHGLRYGVNRLRVLVVEPGSGRYVVLRRRFTVHRAGPLAAAGWDKPTRVGARVRLDGSRSRAFRRGRLRYGWKLVAKPHGAHVALRHRGRARAAFVPHRPGHYVFRLQVRKGSRVGQDRVSVTVLPSSLLLPFAAITHKDGQPGIRVGGDFYANPSPNGKALQWLTLDRATLQPARMPNGQPANNWLDGSGGNGPNGIGTLASTLSGEGLDQLVILAYPYGGPAPPVQSDQDDAFNQAMKTIGVGPIDPGILQDHNKLGIIGVPYAGDGSGWYTHGGYDVDGLKGFLMPDTTVERGSGATHYRFQPQRLPFDTSTSASTQTSNTMELNGQSFNAALPPGATGGFQVVRFNPIDFKPDITPPVFATNGVSDPTDALNAMAKFLNDNGGPSYDVAVQSIGVVGPSNSSFTAANAWRSVASALAGDGANPDTFNTVNGSYAFLGGANIGRDEVAESSSSIVTDPTTSPPTHESGTLQGLARMGPDGYIIPALADTSNSFQDSLDDIAFQPPTPWPYTKAAGDPNADQYAKALAYITSQLPDLKGYYPDLRQAYVGNDNLDYSHSASFLIGMAYPGDGYTCTDDAGRMKKNPGFTRKQFCTLNKELQLEFDWLDATKTLFGAYETALTRSGGQQGADLQSIGEKIRTAVEPPDDAEIATRALAFLETVLGFAGPEAKEAGEVIGFFTSAYELGSTIASSAGGQPVGDQINAKVTDLSKELADNIVQTAAALDRVRDVVISDYGRLQALGSVANGPGWSFDVDAHTNTLTTAGEAYFSSQLMPVAFQPWYLSPTFDNSVPTPDNCYIIGYGHSFGGAPDSSYLDFHDQFEGGEGTVNALALGKHTWTVSQYAYPPAELTDPMFRSVAQNGYGLNLSDFIWKHYKAPYRSVSCYK